MGTWEATRDAGIRSTRRELGRLRICYVIDGLGSGGAQRQLVEIASYLHSHGSAQPSVVCYREQSFFAPRLHHAGVPLHRVPRADSLDPFFPFRLRSAIAETRPDVIHAFLLTPGLWARLATAPAGPGPRPVFIAAERNSLLGATRRQALLQRLLYRTSDAVTVNSARTALRIAERFGVPSARIHYVPNGIDLAAWDLAGQEKPEIEVDDTRFNLALVGGLRPEKNHALLLEALERLPEDMARDLAVWMIGDSTAGSTFADSVRSGIDRSHLKGRIRLLPAVENVAAVLSRMDCLVLPSRWEGFPNVVLEAMASGLPVVATDVGDVARLVEDGVSGRVVAEGDAGGLANALTELYRVGGGRRREMGSRGRARALAMYSIERICERYMDVYRRTRSASASG